MDIMNKLWTIQAEQMFRQIYDEDGHISTMELCSYDYIPPSFMREFKDELDWELIALKLWIMDEDFKREFAEELRDKTDYSDPLWGKIRLELKTQLAVMINMP